MAKTRSISSLNIDSTVLCCNFVNTVSSWMDNQRYDYLATYNDFIDWCLKLNFTQTARLEQLRQLAAQQPGEADAALMRIREIRTVMHNLIAAVAKDDAVAKQQYLPSFNLLLIDAASRQRLLFLDGKFSVGQLNPAGDLTAPAWEAVQSLSGMLVNNDLRRIKECPKCGWVFLDETKNGKRRFCNPKYCGTSDKMMRYNQRKKDNPAS
ncbi:CGNR zinc finger domain-containing protein [Chitinophaga horti]|uniref:CGNR zinc finger domain-containing protein n=1 Tax=Chitinophaga horti TaxID=2920382 RepID=A0ABY6J8G8_9BACT|nr:CGNR zinc finger domain-containing protein [Chitinophaga horti]UYQ95990.1 CGNR zinc finger domain-containing protein [Chitinophaga horti]